MSNPDGLQLERKPSPEDDMERAAPATATTAATGGAESGIGSVLRRWRREDFIRKGSLALRALGFVFSLLSFIIMASNNHGGGRQFGDFEEYRYLLAIAILSTLYTGLQCFRHVNQLSSGKYFVDLKTSALIDFVGDHESPEGRKMLEFRKSLPAFNEKEMLLQAIAKNQVFSKLLGSPLHEAKLSIIKDVSGIIKPGRNQSNLPLEMNCLTKNQSWTKKKHVYETFVKIQWSGLEELRYSSETIKQEMLLTQRTYLEELNHVGNTTTKKALENCYNRLYRSP